MEFCLIMKVQLEEKHLLQKKLLVLYVKLNWENKKNFWEIWKQKEIGHAKDYVLAMWKILQENKPDDFVVATGQQYSVRDFIELALKELDINLNGKVKASIQNAMTLM